MTSEFSEREWQSMERELKTGLVRIKPDDEYAAEQFWDALTEQFPEVANQLREEGRAEVTTEVWDAITDIVGWDDGPSYAPFAVVHDDD